MRTSLFLWLFLISHSLFCISSISAYSQCLDHERTLLLQLKNSLTFDSPYSTKLVSWKNQSTDCCHWDGVACDDVGHVIGLDLNDESISGGIYNSRSLFGLQYLERLNLAYNHFHGAQIPSGFDKLANLAYLNMSYSGFVGQIPIEISHMTRLVTLDLSTYGLELKNPNLMVLVRNLTELRELHLDGVNIWAQGYEWCQALSSLSNLQVLGLSGCGLSGPIDSSLMKLQSLSVIRLDGNNFSAPFPEFFADFSNMTALHLHSSGFYGKVPERIFQIPTVQVLDLSYNELLEGFFPDSVLNLTQIVYLDLSRTRFTGPIPSFRMSKNLIHIDLSSNNFTGNVPSTHFDGLVNLVYIDLRYNSFNGNIPSSLFTLPSLSIIYLSSNQFEGQVAEFPNASSSVLEALDMYNNTLDGPIPLSIFELRRLKHLDLSYNNFSGTIQFEMIQRLSNLIILYLSNNNLSIDASGSNSSSSSFPQFGWLGLASCKLQNFPDLKNQSSLYYLDLSNNQIDGEIPNWIWEVGNGGLFFVNLSHNLLVQLQEPYSFRTSLEYLNLHSNQLHGKIPIPPPEAMFVDYSSNNFSYSIPANIGNYLTNALWFSLSNNSLSGVIPESICEGSSLQLLDLSNNNLNSTIPSCLFERMSDSLEVLNLQGNNLHGNISGTFPSNCSLQTLDLNGNHLEGWVPESLTNCKRLELLNLGDNKINDTFPCWLENLSSLRIMVLRSNRFHGHIGCLDANHSWPVLQIIDIASNSFSGDLPRRCFLNWRAMMVVKNEEPPTLSDVVMFSGGYYQNTVTVSNKGQSMELEKILTIFTSIDFSSNSFQGEIPEAIGNLKSLLVLNLSHNDLDGRIPPSIGNLRQLESLDLSDNKLRGEIPAQLATLTFLSCLNLSYNQLVGMIPRGTQFQTFTETTFEGNKGLCGPPLNRSCNNTTMAGLPPPRIGDRHSYPTNEINWNWISAELGFVTGLGSIVGSLLFCKRWRRWYYKHVDRVLLRILPGRVNHRRRAYRNPIRRL